MENINPSLACIISLRQQLACNESMSTALKYYFDQHDDELAQQIQRWHLAYKNNLRVELADIGIKGIYRQELVHLIEEALSGAGVSKALAQLQKDVEQACDDEINENLRNLPQVAVLPVLIFIFPAVLIIGLGPMLSHMLMEVS